METQRGGAVVYLYFFFNHGARLWVDGQRHVPETGLYLLHLLFASVCVSGWELPAGAVTWIALR